jgi:hypothetical protein
MSVREFRRTFRRGGTIAVATVAALATGGTAFAFWSSGGTGSGNATARTAQALTTTATTLSANLLFPGGTGDVKLTINNGNPFAVTVTAVNGNGTITSDKGAACDASPGVTFTSTSGLSVVVPANSSATTTLGGKVAMSNSSDTTCQGAVFNIPVSLVAASS